MRVLGRALSIAYFVQVALGLINIRYLAPTWLHDILRGVVVQGESQALRRSGADGRRAVQCPAYPFFDLVVSRKWNTTRSSHTPNRAKMSRASRSRRLPIASASLTDTQLSATPRQSRTT